MNAKNDLLFFLMILVGLFVVWIGTGGPERASNKKQGIVLEETTISADTREYTDTDENEEAEETTPIPSGISPHKDQITIVKSTSGPRRKEASKEYIEIRANRNNTAPISITNWRVASIVSGVSFKIKGGVRLPRSGIISPDEAIFLNPGDRAYITTGRSPIGVSFRTNICTGYFEQFQDFTPSLRRECPYPDDELEITTQVIRTFGNQCLDFIESMPRCTMQVNSLPFGFSSECTDFISTEINYTGCIGAHKDDTDFYKNEWRVYLGRDKEIWRDKRDTIVLVDTKGKTVDTYTY